MAGRHPDQLCFSIAHHAHLQTFSAEKQCIRRNHHRTCTLRQFEVHLNIRARHETATSVVYIHFDQQGARGQIDRIRVSHQSAVERLSGIFIEGQIRRPAGARGERIHFRNWHVDSQRGDGSDVE